MEALQVKNEKDIKGLGGNTHVMEISLTYDF